jgi:hypothetical protein
MEQSAPLIKDKGRGAAGRKPTQGTSKGTCRRDADGPTRRDAGAGCQSRSRRDCRTCARPRDGPHCGAAHEGGAPKEGTHGAEKDRQYEPPGFHEC